MEQYNGASEEEKNAFKDALNERVDGFGDDFYDSRSAAKMAWSDLGKDDREVVAALIEETLFDPETGEGE